ncbi:DUF1353 domain-containing protein [Thalassotalea ganghwensis]
MIYFLGQITFVLILIYVVLLFIRKAVESEVDKVKTIIGVENMPVLRPIPIATVKQKDPLNKLLAFVFCIRKWRLEEAFVYEYRGKRYAIHAGFVFDGASIPKVLWALISPVGLLLIPGLIHDYGYRYNGIYVIDDDGNVNWDTSLSTQQQWDQLFRDIGDEVNQMPVLNALAEFGLWLGGFKAWDTWRDNKELQQPFVWRLGQADAPTAQKETTNEPQPPVVNNDSDIDAEQPLESHDSDQDFVSGTTKTTQIDYTNANQQKVHGTRHVEGTDNNQVAYKLECLACGEVYGANGSEIYRRKCPKCQGGKPGITY